MKTKTKEYIRPIPVSYWFTRRAYIFFMVRELSALFIGAYAVLLLFLLARARDEAAFQAFLNGLKSPLSILFHLVVLGFAIYHTVTFFSIAPRVLVLHRGEERVPDGMISGAHYLVWLLVSIVLFVIAIRA